jgi:hypothetical protein
MRASRCVLVCCLQFLGGKSDLVLASGYLQHGYEVARDPAMLIADAIALPVIMVSREEVQQDRSRVEAALAKLLGMTLRWVGMTARAGMFDEKRCCEHGLSVDVSPYPLPRTCLASLKVNSKESEYLPFSLVYHGENDRKLQVRPPSPLSRDWTVGACRPLSAQPHLLDSW